MKRLYRVVNAFLTRRLVITLDRMEFVYKDLSWKRLTNWFLAETGYLLKRNLIRTYPTHLQIEPTDRCNLRCTVCHVVTDDKLRGMLTPENFRRVIDEIGDYLLVINMWGWGEPFLNPEIFSMIRYAKERGIKVITSTNGHFFDSDEAVDRLIDSGLDVLIFALDGVDRESYAKYRQGGDFDKVIQGLERLVRRRKERGAATPRINLRMVVTSDNEDQVPQMQKLASEAGVDAFSFKTMNSFDNKDDGDSLVPHNKAYRRFSYDEAGEPIRTKNTCKKFWNHMTIYRDGLVVPCSFHTGRDLAFGNVFNGDTTCTRIWFGEEYRNLRSRFAAGDLAGLRCENCVLSFADLDRSVPLAVRFR